MTGTSEKLPHCKAHATLDKGPVLKNTVQRRTEHSSVHNKVQKAADVPRCNEQLLLLATLIRNHHSPEGTASSKVYVKPGGWIACSNQVWAMPAVALLV
jgi:hypothetical protein